MEAWRSEFWPPAVAEGALAIVTALARKCAWLADSTARRQFAIAVPQVDPLRYPSKRDPCITANLLIEEPLFCSPQCQACIGQPRFLDMRLR